MWQELQKHFSTVVSILVGAGVIVSQTKTFKKWWWETVAEKTSPHCQEICRISELKDKMTKQNDLLLAMSANTIYHLSNKAIEKSFLPLNERTILAKLGKAYFNSGGNSVAGDTFQLAMRLPYTQGGQTTYFNLNEFLED